ncbi:hypothetical protein SABIM44S_00051 [Streptomyces abikoensis]
MACDGEGGSTVTETVGKTVHEYWRNCSACEGSGTR